MMQDFLTLLDSVRRRTGLYLVGGSYNEIVAFLLGYDQAYAGEILAGFREWLIVKNDGANNLAWSALVLELAFPEEPVPRQAMSNSADNERRAIEILFDLVTEFIEKKDRSGLEAILRSYQEWLARQELYD